MQHTEKYQFNLIDSSDPFSAQPLNDNMEKTEGALTAHRAEVNAALSALGTKVAALPRMVTGSYTGANSSEYGEGHPTVLEFPDAERPPALILISDTNASVYGAMFRGMKSCLVYWDTYVRYYVHLTWTDKGVRFYSTHSADHQFNHTGKVYHYVAFI